MSSRSLTPAQHAKLERLAGAEPNARVFGWHLDGPVLHRPQLENPYWRVTFDGRLKPVARAVLEEIR